MSSIIVSVKAMVFPSNISDPAPKSTLWRMPFIEIEPRSGTALFIIICWASHWPAFLIVTSFMERYPPLSSTARRAASRLAIFCAAVPDILLPSESRIFVPLSPSPSPKIFMAWPLNCINPAAALSSIPFNTLTPPGL